MTAIPPAISEAGRSWAALRAERPKVTSSPMIEPGQVRVLHPVPHDPCDPRLGVVLAVDARNEFVEILLVHTSPELATDTDVVASRRATGLAHDLVVESDLRAIVWTTQLGPSIGSLDLSSLIRSVQPSRRHRADVDDQYPTGTPLQGPADGRWSFKEAEGSDLRSLSADCTSALIDRELVWAVDPRLLRPDVLDLVDDPLALIGEVIHWLRTRKTCLADEDARDVQLLVSTLDPATWREVPDLASTIVDALCPLLVGAATTAADELGDTIALLSFGHQPEDEVDTRYEAVHVVAAAGAGAR